MDMLSVEDEHLTSQRPWMVGWLNVAFGVTGAVVAGAFALSKASPFREDPTGRAMAVAAAIAVACGALCAAGAWLISVRDDSWQRRGAARLAAITSGAAAAILAVAGFLPLFDGAGLRGVVASIVAAGSGVFFFGMIAGVNLYVAAWDPQAEDSEPPGVESP